MATVTARNNQHVQQQKKMKRDDGHGDVVSYVHTMYYVLVHIVTILIYAIPMFWDHTSSSSSMMLDPYNEHPQTLKPVLDEIHILSSDNADVSDPKVTLRDIFIHDYWGRPMDAPNSHKSWRPLSILSFRYLNFASSDDNDKDDETFRLLLHRFINVILHAAVAELIGILAVQVLLPQHNNKLRIRIISKLAFALHPTHVETTVNAANRPHLLALLMCVYSCDPNTPLLLYMLAICAGYLSCETFLFQIVPIAMTMFLIQYQKQQSTTRRRSNSSNSSLIRDIFDVAFWQLGIRLLFLALSAIAYFGLRWYYDTLSIPEGLIRPAENPFYTLTGTTRFWSYLMVFGIHVYKQMDFDYIGFSHEYGYECISIVTHGTDPRLYPVYGLMLLHILIISVLVSLRIRRQQQQQRPPDTTYSQLTTPEVLYLLYLSWTFTLFPVSGILKVGTFIADRLVVASTVPMAILVAVVAPRRRQFVLLLFALVAWKRIYTRSQEWMDSKDLLDASLRTCPRYAKAHLEISKIYSGLYPHLYNLTQSRWHLDQAAAIDPDYCDVHLQFAHVSVQENRFLEMEESLVQALFCQYTMGQAMPMWQNYWSIQLDPTKTPTPNAVETNRRRYDAYQKRISEMIEQEVAKGDIPQEQKSPFAVKWAKQKA